MHKSFSIIIVDISLHKKWGELKFLLDFNAIDRTKEGTLRETFAFQQFHKKHRFSSSVHSLKHNCDTQCTVSVKMLLMWMLHTVVNLANPTSMNWKLILTQNQISCVKLQHGSQSSSPDWLWGFFSFLTSNESFLISVIVVTFPQLSCRLFLSGGQLIQERLTCQKPSKWLCCVWNGRVCVRVCRKRICASLIMCAFVCVCVIKDGVWNLKLKQDAQINDLQPVPLSPSEMNHPVKLWWYMANNNTWLWVVRFTHLKREKGK